MLMKAGNLDFGKYCNEVLKQNELPISAKEEPIQEKQHGGTEVHSESENNFGDSCSFPDNILQYPIEGPHFDLMNERVQQQNSIMFCPAFVQMEMEKSKKRVMQTDDPFLRNKQSFFVPPKLSASIERSIAPQKSVPAEPFALMQQPHTHQRRAYSCDTR